MRWLFLLVLLSGVALRVEHLDYGLDTRDLSRSILSHQQDEEGMVRAVLSGAGAGRFRWQSQSAGLLRGDPHPGIYMLWGSLGFYVFGAADAAVLWPMSWSHPGGWSGLLAELDGNPSLLHLVHRGVSVLAAVLALLAVGRIARRLLGVRGELLALAIAACSYLPAREAHFGVLDTLAALWIVLAVEQALLIARDGSRRAYVLAGLFIGLAAATKYFGGLVVLVVLAAHVGAARRAGRATHALPRLVLAGVVSLVAFVAVSPQLLFWPDELKGALAWQRDTIGINLVNESGGPWELALHHVRHTFASGFGETALVFAVVGAWLLWRRGPEARLVVLSVLLLLPIFFVARSPAVRYGIASVLLLAVPAAAFCEAAADALGRRWPQARGAVLLGALLLCVAPSLARILYFNRALGRPDTRTEALGWLAELHVPSEEVFAFGYTGLPRPGLIAKWPLPYVDYLRAVVGGKRFTREQGRLMRPRYVLHDGTGSNFDSAGWADWVDIVATEYHVLHRLEPRDDPDIRLPDKAAGTPSFYLPFDQPWAMDRPGPVLTLYERNDAPR
jgi:Dolichyl-phosphate-mannose-protein mannosyltransferase